jgi:hypothetical protein
LVIKNSLAGGSRITKTLFDAEQQGSVALQHGAAEGGDEDSCAYFEHFEPLPSEEIDINQSGKPPARSP